MDKILIIDDELDICELLTKFFKKKGFEAAFATNGSEGIELLKKEKYSLVICDFRLPDYDGLEILQKIKVIDDSAQVIIITGYSDVKIAVEALRKGAFDYVTKPLYPDEILNTVREALGSTKVPAKKKVQGTKTNSYLTGVSQQSQLAKKHIDLIGPTDMTVVILGETGTGKEYVARAIHEQSKRSTKPFVAIDCGALPKELAGSELFGHVKGAFTGALNDKKGSFELANGGTLFLDELGNLSYDNQVKLLRVLQERMIKKVGGTNDIPIDVRVLVATNEDLLKKVSEGEFREDIFYRINEFKIELSPLRQRNADVELFANHFLQDAAKQIGKDVPGIDKEALLALKNYNWPGNLRELRNVIKRAVLLSKGNEITTSDLPQEVQTPQLDLTNTLVNDGSPKSLKEVVEHAEKQAILQALKASNYNKSQAAKLLQVDRKTLYNKMELLDIDFN